jgi:parallel beta-helix repeat protein
MRTLLILPRLILPRLILPLLIVLPWPVSMFALTEEDVIRALQNPDNHGIVHLESGEYRISHPIVLNENQQLLGKNTKFKVSWPQGYWFTAVTIRPNKTETVDVAAILETSPQVKLKMTSESNSESNSESKSSALPKSFPTNAKVALSGFFPGENGARQTLISSIRSIDDDVVTLNDPLTFSITATKEHGITLTKLVDMNCTVSGVTFAEPDHSGNGLTYINVEPYCQNVSISDCTFDAKAAKPPAYSSGVAAAQSVVQVSRCNFEGFSLDAARFLDTGEGCITDCTIKNSNHAITLFLAHSAHVSSNVITDGAAAFGNNSTGVFLSGEPTGVWGTNNVGDKSCFNVIANNTVDGAGYGVPGAGFAGIHLHRKSHFNTIQNNRCTHNGMGIYLETDNDHNRIAFNVCSENNLEKHPNHYGNGIELDWDNDFNMIESNRCEGNHGSGEALGYGIEIRNGTDHDNRYNTVADNVIANTGGVGLVVRGTGTRVIGNHLDANGSDPASERRHEIEIEGNAIVVANNTITPGTAQKSKSAPKEAKSLGYSSIVVGKGENVVITNNDLDAGSCSDGGIVVLPGVRNLSVTKNRIASTTPSGSVISVAETVHVDILENTFKTVENGFPEITCHRPQGFLVNNTNRLDTAFESAHRPGKPLKIEIVEGSDVYSGQQAP